MTTVLFCFNVFSIYSTSWTTKPFSMVSQTQKLSIRGNQTLFPSGLTPTFIFQHLYNDAYFLGSGLTSSRTPTLCLTWARPTLWTAASRWWLRPSWTPAPPQTSSWVILSVVSRILIPIPILPDCHKGDDPFIKTDSHPANWMAFTFIKSFF